LEKGEEMQDAGWRPQIREAKGGKEDEEILLADRRSSESDTLEGSRSRSRSRSVSSRHGDDLEKEGEEDEDDGESLGGEGEEGQQRGLSRSTKGTIWVVLMTMSTLLGRRILRGGFRELPFLVGFERE